MINLKGQSFLIRVDGSHAIGLGHIYRMKTLALALQEAGSHVAFLTGEDKAANSLLKATGLTCYVFQPDSYNAALTEAIQAQQPDLIIQDILETIPECIEAIRQLSPAKIINLDDVGAGLAMADVVINSIVFNWGRYRAEESQARLFEGPQYMILQPAISQYARLDKTIPDRAENILLAFGGTDTQHLTEMVLQAINGIGTTLNVKINLGPGSEYTPCLDQAVKASRHHVKVMRSVPNLFEECFKTDLVICAGGIMLYELAALGVPSVAIAAEPHEAFTVDYWSGVGTTAALGRGKTLNLTQVSDAVGNLLGDRRRRAEMSRIGKQTVDDLGLTRVLKIIDEVLR